jgi:hypothetical protein
MVGPRQILVHNHTRIIMGLNLFHIFIINNVREMRVILTQMQDLTLFNVKLNQPITTPMADLYQTTLDGLKLRRWVTV